MLAVVILGDSIYMYFANNKKSGVGLTPPSASALAARLQEIAEPFPAMVTQ